MGAIYSLATSFIRKQVRQVPRPNLSKMAKTGAKKEAIAVGEVRDSAPEGAEEQQQLESEQQARAAKTTDEADADRERKLHGGGGSDDEDMPPADDTDLCFRATLPPGNEPGTPKDDDGQDAEEVLKSKPASKGQPAMPSRCNCSSCV